MQNYTIRIVLKSNKTVMRTFAQKHTNFDTAVVAFNKLNRIVHQHYASLNFTTSAYIFDANNNAVY